MHKRMVKKYIGAVSVIMGFIGACSLASYYMAKRQTALEMALQRMKCEIQEQKKMVKQPVIEATPELVTASQLWRPVQEKVANTVVQIFAQIAEMDLLQPYKTPQQGTTAGSGFFINDEGEILTNAHVVNEAKAIWIQIPALGKTILDTELISMCPERDIALLKVDAEGLKQIKKILGNVPCLSLGDSDCVRRSDEVLALGYPLGQQALKSTTGVISGREQHLIQLSAPINPGNSGGPLLNVHGDVIGINNSGVTAAQNVGYAIPINEVKHVLADMHTTPLLRKPYLGILVNNATPEMAQYLGNPEPAGCYVVEVVKGSTLAKAGVQTGDMLYEINGHAIDMYGELRVSWNEDPMSIMDYVACLSLGQEISLVFYRKGVRKEVVVEFTENELPPIRKIFPSYEAVDFEVFGGMVVMELTLDHINLLQKQAPGLVRYSELRNQTGPALIITHMFPSSHLYRSRTIMPGSVIREINGHEVHNLEDFRKAVKQHMSNPYFTIRAADNARRISDNIFVALSFDKLLAQELQLARDYKYQVTALSRDMLRAKQAQAVLKDMSRIT